MGLCLRFYSLHHDQLLSQIRYHKTKEAVSVVFEINKCLEVSYDTGFQVKID